MGSSTPGGFKAQASGLVVDRATGIFHHGLDDLVQAGQAIIGADPRWIAVLIPADDACGRAENDALK